MANEPYALTVDTRDGGPCHQPLRPFLPAPQEATNALKGADDAVRAAPRPPPQADHPDEAVAFASNAVWRRLVDFARHQVAFHRDQGRGSRQEFDAELVWEAFRISGSSKKTERAAVAKARSVAAWTWTNYHPSEPKPSLSPEECTARKKVGQATAAAGRRTKTTTAAIKAYRHLVATDQRPAQVAVAAAIGKTPRALRPVWTEIMAAATSDAPLKPEVQYSL